MTPEHWVEHLRTYRGLRFAIRGRSWGGVDCWGLAALAMKEAGLGERAMSVPYYANKPSSDTFISELNAAFEPLPYNRLHNLFAQIEVGDIIAFWLDDERNPRHMAIYTGTDRHDRHCVIHSKAVEERRVVEEPMKLGFWKRRVHSLWRVPGLER